MTASAMPGSGPGPVALITGSVRRLGAHLAARLGEAGYRIALHGSHDAGPEPWLAERLASAGIDHARFVGDLSDRDFVGGLIGTVSARFDAPVALLVNNASMFDAAASETPSLDDLVDHFTVNAAAPVMLAGMLAGQAPAGGAAVVNIVDQRIAHPPRDQPAYTLSKQALGEATRTLAIAMAPNVRVNAVAPGLTIATPDYQPGQIDRIAAMMPLERLATPDDIADACLYLASARAVTGQTLFVDGGASLARFDRDFVHLGRE